VLKERFRQLLMNLMVNGQVSI